jgi:hypothetical protein
MEEKKKQEVIQALEKYVPIKANIRSFTTEKAPEYLATILKNNDKLDSFLLNPEQELKANGISPEEINIPLFTELAIYLKNRQAHTKEGPMTTNPTKTKDKGAQWEFDQSRSWIRKVESAVIHERGRSEQKVKEELLETKKDFDEKTEKTGIGMDSTILMNPKLRAHFFPAQPLVTPELIQEIKAILDA